MHTCALIIKIFFLSQNFFLTWFVMLGLFLCKSCVSFASWISVRHFTLAEIFGSSFQHFLVHWLPELGSYSWKYQSVHLLSWSLSISSGGFLNQLLDFQCPNLFNLSATVGSILHLLVPYLCVMEVSPFDIFHPPTSYILCDKVTGVDFIILARSWWVLFKGMMTIPGSSHIFLH